MHESDARFPRDRWADLKNPFRQISGSMCAPRGFKCASVFCDIKKLGTGKGSEKGQKRDLALIVSDVPAAVAGVFTTNQICAAPVKVSRRAAAKDFARGIVVNSGNANAATGPRGMRDARSMIQLAAKALSINENDVLVCSTGRIGVAMPMKNIEGGIRACATRIARSISNARQVAEAIMTTDTRRKEIAVEFRIGRSTIRIGGVCKGAGMIQPGMATMLGFIASDAAIEPAALKRALKIAVEQSFNRITRDGEGTSRFVALHLRGARNDREAGSAARAIANSSLVRTSWGGGDPNWGRILCALGYSKAGVDERIVDVGYAQPGSHKIVFAFRRGRPTNVALKTLARITSAPEFDLHVNLHRGRGEFVLYAADLTEDYVAFNKGDITDPATLGG